MSPRASRRTRSRPGPVVARPGGDLGGRIAMTALAAALVGGTLLVDTTADAAFDAPKRLVAILGIAVAALALLLSPPWTPNPAAWWRTATRAQRAALVLGAGALASALTSAALSPRPIVSLHTLRAVLLFALLLPLGASRALDGGRSSILAGVFVGASLVNAVVSALQFAGIVKLFRVRAIGGRLDVSAFVGNDGVLALALALACLVSGAVLLIARGRRLRLAAGGGLLVLLAALAINQGLTALIALTAGATVLLVSRSRRWHILVGVAGVVIVLAGGVALHGPFAARARQVVSAVASGDWDRALTYRLGPWAAAVEMARARPLTGAGPGMFGAEFVPNRLQAELRHHRRLANPHLAGSYTEAHSDYLHVLAELGIPGGLAAVAAIGALLVGLALTARRSGDGPLRGEAIVVLAFLSAGAAAALTWFPFERPVTAIPLLLAVGRAWKLCGGERQSAAVERSASPGGRAIAARAAMALLILVAVVPEITRYTAERRLYRASAVLQAVFGRSPDATTAGRIGAWGASTALDASAALPGDWRPLNVAGSAFFLARRPEAAIERYREALALGERPEIVANLGRAYLSLGQEDRARAAFLRAAWASPALLAGFPGPLRAAVRSEMEVLEGALASGRLGAPPGLP